MQEISGYTKSYGRPPAQPLDNQFVRDAAKLLPPGVDRLLNYNGKISKVILPD